LTLDSRRIAASRRTDASGQILTLLAERNAGSLNPVPRSNGRCRRRAAAASRWKKACRPARSEPWSSIGWR